jgi:transcription antitermination factor NusG
MSGEAKTKVVPGQVITPPPGTQYTIREVDEDNKQVMLEFEYQGNTCTCWVPMAEVEKVKRTRR